MYILGISMAITNCTKAVKLIYSFIVSIQKLNISFEDYSMTSHFFQVQNSISVVFYLGVISFHGIQTLPP